MRVLCGWLVVCLCLLLPMHAQAQSGGLIVRVRGPVGPVANADVEVSFSESILIQSQTDETGRVLIWPLPPGTYTVSVEVMGYSRAEEKGVRVDPGAQRTLEFRLSIAPVKLERFTVTQNRRVAIERETVEFSTELEEEAISILPVSRETRELVALTPGARPNHVWGGASAQANNYRLDGLSVNDPGRGADLFKPSPLWIEGVEVRGLGAGAEYGGFQGGLVDVVTKRGRNDFEGSIRSTMENDLLTGSNLVPSEVGREVVGRLDVEGEARGAFVRDQLFYYLSGQRIAQSRRAMNHLDWVEEWFTPFQEQSWEHRGFGKVSWTPSALEVYEVAAGFDDTRADNHELNGYEGPGATHRYSSPTWLLTGTGRKIFQGWGQLEAGLNHVRSDERYDADGGTGVPGITNYTPTPPHNAFGNAPLTLRSAPTSTSATLTGTLRLRAGGQEYSLKIGAEYTRGSFLNRRTRNGGMTWLPHPSRAFDPEETSTWSVPETGEISTLWGGEVHLDADVASTAAFVQTTIALGSRVVLSPGLRWGRWKGWIDPLSGERFLAVQDDAWDPRVGLSVDLTGHGTLVAKAHWGRYHQSMIAQMFDRAAGADAFTNEEFWSYSGQPPTDRGQAFTLAERDSLASLGLFQKVGETVLNETGRVEGYRQPYVDQWLVALEKRVGSSAKFEFLYARRSNRDMVALVDLNRESNYTRYENVYPFRWARFLPFEGGSVVMRELRIPGERLRLGDQGIPLGDPPPRRAGWPLLDLPGGRPLLLYVPHHRHGHRGVLGPLPRREWFRNRSRSPPDPGRRVQPSPLRIRHGEERDGQPQPGLLGCTVPLHLGRGSLEPALRCCPGPGPAPDRAPGDDGVLLKVLAAFPRKRLLPIQTLPCTGCCAEIRSMTKQALLSEILRLPLEERIELLGEAWDAISATPEDVPIPEWHVRELEQRLSDPSPAYVPWEEVRARLRSARSL